MGRTSEIDISQITDQLYIAAWPKGHHRQDLLDINASLIISMILQKHDKELDEPPLRLLRYLTIDSIFTPIPIRVLSEGSLEGINEIDNGKIVVVYCRKGVHRSAAMAAAILIRQGLNTDEAIDLIKSKRSVAKPDDWYIKRRLVKFEKELNNL